APVVVRPAARVAGNRAPPPLVPAERQALPIPLPDLRRAAALEHEDLLLVQVLLRLQRAPAGNLRDVDPALGLERPLELDEGAESARAAPGAAGQRGDVFDAHHRLVHGYALALHELAVRELLRYGPFHTIISNLDFHERGQSYRRQEGRSSRVTIASRVRFT